MSTIAFLGAFLRRENQAAVTSSAPQPSDFEALGATDVEEALGWPELRIPVPAVAAGGRAIRVPSGP